jgi:hypothetical protein
MLDKRKGVAYRLSAAEAKGINKPWPPTTPRFAGIVNFGGSPAGLARTVTTLILLGFW